MARLFIPGTEDWLKTNKPSLWNTLSKNDKIDIELCRKYCKFFGLCYDEYLNHPREDKILTTAIYRLTKLHTAFFRPCTKDKRTCELSNKLTSKNLIKLSCGHEFLVWNIRYWMKTFKYVTCPLCCKEINCADKEIVFYNHPRLRYDTKYEKVEPYMYEEDKPIYPFHCVLITDDSGILKKLVPPLYCIFMLKKLLWKVRHTIESRKRNLESIRCTLLNYFDSKVFDNMLSKTPLVSIFQIVNKVSGIDAPETLEETYFTDNVEVLILVFIYWYRKNNSTFPLHEKFIPWFQYPEDDCESDIMDYTSDTEDSIQTEQSETIVYIDVIDYVSKISCNVYGWRSTLYTRFYRALRLNINFEENELIKNIELSVIGYSTLSPISGPTRQLVDAQITHISEIPPLCILNRSELYFIEDCEDVINYNLKENVNDILKIQDASEKILKLREAVGNSIHWAMASNEEQLDYDYNKISTHILSRMFKQLEGLV